MPNSNPRRKSAFAGQNPVLAGLSTPPIQPDPPAEPALDPMPPRTPVKTTGTEKITIRIPSELADKVRTATLIDGAPRGIRGLSAWICDALQERIFEIEADTGQPLLGTKTGILPAGWSSSNKQGTSH